MQETRKIIECKSWMKLGYPNFEDNFTLPSESIVYCNIEHIPIFFAQCKNSNRKYIVVSGYSDFGPCLQAENPVWMDLPKWIYMHPLHTLGYRGITVDGRCNKDKCKLSDKYSIKCWSFTYATFPEIPNNIVKWFCVNNSLDDDRVVSLPLGIAENDSDLLSSIQKPQNLKNKIYINFENYNIDRVKYKEILSKYDFTGKYTIIDKPNLPKQKYLQDIANHKFVFCPHGNGIDTYRLWETKYLQSIPILFRHNYYNQWPLKAIYIDDIKDLINLDIDTYDYELHYFNDKQDMLFLDYWKNMIESCVKLI